MKKIISLFLALLMAFSVVTVAFAEGEAPDATPDTETTAPVEGEGEGTEEAIPDLGELNWILDLPFWTVGPAFKLAKIAFKLVSVYLKVAKIFGIVDKDMSDMALDVILGLIEQGEAEQAPETEETTAAPEVTEAPAVA